MSSYILICYKTIFTHNCHEWRFFLLSVRGGCGMRSGDQLFSRHFKILENENNKFWSKKCVTHLFHHIDYVIRKWQKEWEGKDWTLSICARCTIGKFYWVNRRYHSKIKHGLGFAPQRFVWLWRVCSFPIDSRMLFTTFIHFVLVCEMPWIVNGQENI